jgi:hypothetical protein
MRAALLALPAVEIMNSSSGRNLEGFHFGL